MESKSYVCDGCGKEINSVCGFLVTSAFKAEWQDRCGGRVILVESSTRSTSGTFASERHFCNQLCMAERVRRGVDLPVGKIVETAFKPGLDRQKAPVGAKSTLPPLESSPRPPADSITGSGRGRNHDITMNTKEIAGFLGIHSSSVFDIWSRGHILRTEKKDGKCHLYDSDSVYAYKKYREAKRLRCAGLPAVVAPATVVVPPAEPTPKRKVWKSYRTISSGVIAVSTEDAMDYLNWRSKESVLNLMRKGFIKAAVVEPYGAANRKKYFFLTAELDAYVTLRREQHSAAARARRDAKMATAAVGGNENAQA